MTEKELSEMISKDVTVITEENVFEMTTKYASNYHKYAEIRYKQNKILDKLTLELDKVYGILYQQYRYENKSNGYALDTKSEVEIYIKKDPEYQEIYVKYLNQKSLIKYLDTTLDIIKSNSYLLKSYPELKKLYEGM